MNPTILALNFVIAAVAIVGVARLVQLFNRKYHEASDYKAKAESLETQLRLLQRRKDGDETSLMREMGRLRDMNHKLSEALHHQTTIKEITFGRRGATPIKRFKLSGKVESLKMAELPDSQTLRITERFTDGSSLVSNYKLKDITSGPFVVYGS